MDKGQFLKNEILKMYPNLKAFAASIELPYTTLLSIINNVDGAGLKNVIKICTGLSLDIDQLDNSEKLENSTRFTNIFPIETKKFPLLGEIACGEPIFAAEEFEAYVEAGADIVADFCLRCKGDSMVNARILDGDIVFIRKQSTVNNGEIAVVVIEDEATLKRVFYYPDKSKLVLQSENPTYEPFIYVGEEIDHILILGKAVAFQSDVK